MADYSLLVVEDEHTLRRLLEYRLGKHYRVRTASDGVEALTLVNEEPPDLIVSDIMMPRMNGFTLQNKLQADKKTRAIPFIFLTAKADESSRMKGMRTGVDDYITKPFDVEQLISRIERLLKRTEIFRTELDSKIGQDFSKKLMPKHMPQVPGYRIFFENHPHDHGGGDLFDWSEPEDGIYFLTIGDVMGKGLQAKFYAFSFLSYVRGTLHTMLRETTSPAELMRRVNRVLLEDQIMDETFASLLLMRWEPERHTITYANAGHCRPALLTPTGPHIVEHSDLVLGLEPGATFKNSSLTMEPGTALMLYTDGLMEQRLRSGKMLGEQGVVGVASEVRSAKKPTERIVKAVIQESRGQQFDDDILIFWLQREEGSDK